MREGGGLEYVPSLHLGCFQGSSAGTFHSVVTNTWNCRVTQAASFPGKEHTTHKPLIDGMPPPECAYRTYPWEREIVNHDPAVMSTLPTMKDIHIPMYN